VAFRNSNTVRDTELLVGNKAYKPFVISGNANEINGYDILIAITHTTNNQYKYYDKVDRIPEGEKVDAALHMVKIHVASMWRYECNKAAWTDYTLTCKLMPIDQYDNVKEKVVRYMQKTYKRIDADVNGVMVFPPHMLLACVPRVRVVDEKYVSTGGGSSRARRTIRDGDVAHVRTASEDVGAWNERDADIGIKTGGGVRGMGGATAIAVTITAARCGAQLDSIRRYGCIVISFMVRDLSASVAAVWLLYCSGAISEAEVTAVLRPVCVSWWLGATYWGTAYACGIKPGLVEAQVATVAIACAPFAL
jgi:hypothetical protein